MAFNIHHWRITRLITKGYEPSPENPLIYWKKVISLSGEVWKLVPGYKTYWVSNLGRLRSRRGLLKKKPNKSGRIEDILYKNSKRKYQRRHRSVMKAFVGKSKLDINHKNFDMADNKLDNLEYCTALYNIRYSKDRGRYSRALAKKLSNPENSKISWEDACEIRELVKNGEPRKYLARVYGISKSHIDRIIRFECWPYNYSAKLTCV